MDLINFLLDYFKIMNIHNKIYTTHICVNIDNYNAIYHVHNEWYPLFELDKFHLYELIHFLNIYDLNNHTLPHFIHQILINEVVES